MRRVLVGCSHCGRTILFGGRRELGGVYCSAQCVQCAVLLHESQRVPATLAELHRAMTCTEPIGRWFKNELRISPEGITWKKKHRPLEAVTGIRWGVTRITVNLVYATTNCSIGFGDAQGSTALTLGDEVAYLRIVTCLWRATGARLIAELAQGLKAGGRYDFGNFQVEDDAVWLRRLGKAVRVPLSQISMSTSLGQLVLVSQADRWTDGRASFDRHWNTLVLENLMRRALQSGAGRLSSVAIGARR